MSDENTPEKEGNRRFDYEIGMWRDADGKEINQINANYVVLMIKLHIFLSLFVCRYLFYILAIFL